MLDLIQVQKYRKTTMLYLPDITTLFDEQDLTEQELEEAVAF